MKDIQKRIEKVERTLGMGTKQRKPDVICINERMYNEPEPVLPKNVEEWLTYQKQLQKDPNRDLIILFASDELKAKELQKNNKKQQK
jgi:hypothetical protein